MQQLIATIENLLIEHDCVVVPGLGGFIHQRQEAYYDKNAGLFYPSGKHLSFNARLHYNDGLLCQAYQMQFALSFEAANQRIRQTVAEIKEYLSQYHYLSFGCLGHLSLRSELLVFEPALRNDLCALSFGLKACAFTPAKQEQPIHRANWLSYVAATAACLLLLFTFIQDNQYLNRESLPAKMEIQEAAVMPLCSLKPTAVPTPAELSAEMLASSSMERSTAMPTSTESTISTTSFAENQAEAKTEVSSDLSAQATTTNTASVNSNAVSEKSNALATSSTAEATSNLAATSLNAAVTSSNTTVQETSASSNHWRNYPTSEKQYLIVIASFPTLEQAEQYIKSRHLQEEYPGVGVAISAERCRVYAQAYSDKSQALSHLNDFRQAYPKYAKAWVLVH